MATPEYAKAVALASRLIKKKGRSVTVTHPRGSGDANAARPWGPPAAGSTSFTTYGVFLEPNSKEHKMFYSLKGTPGTDVAKYDYEVIIPGVDTTTGLAFPFVPDRGDRLGDGSDTYGIVSVSPIKPGPDIVAYLLQVEK